MQTFKVVKNISDMELTIPNVGMVQPGGTIEVPADFNNPNFEVAKKSKDDSQNGDETEPSLPAKKTRSQE